MSVNVKLIPSLQNEPDFSGDEYQYEVSPGGALSVLKVTGNTKTTEVVYGATAWLKVSGDAHKPPLIDQLRNWAKEH